MNLAVPSTFVILRPPDLLRPPDEALSAARVLPMKLFTCQHCRQALFFENARCESCGRELGFLAARETMTALESLDGALRALAEPRGRYRYCDNARHGVCNWLVADGGEPFCAACRHNRTIPDLARPGNLARWRRIEIAKHRLFYSLLRLSLPLASRSEDAKGLGFDFLSDDASAAPVMTGHASGLITINLAEADDAERERRRSQMGEPYRTLLGHFRHEIAHFYWDRLVASTDSLALFRSIFGDERTDYPEALKRHYADGPPANWADHFITAYASAHPWEDFAETWAHYFHMVDTLETAAAFGLRARPDVPKGPDLSIRIDFDAYRAPLNRLVDAWLPLTFAINSINRSMGLQDLYPFALAPGVIVKLGFVHERIHAHDGHDARNASPTVLRAMVAALRRKVGSPEPT